jgi:phytoene dehydrogenase-like protein
MPRLNANEYDGVIIGAGISGLVCGCYLAKAGMKVLIAEQHYKPGGYCTSFKRGEFNFAASAHFLGGFRYGNLNTIFNDLGISEKLIIKKFDPSNKIITPNYIVSFWADLGRTIKDFQTVFPDESDNIEAFFNFLIKSDPKASLRMRTWTFKDLLDTYFASAELKSILSFPLFGNAALPPSLMSAFIGIKIYREFLLDGGYYLEGGMQVLPDALAQRFKEFGGELQLSKLVKKIRIKNGKALGIYVDQDEFISADYVISNCDARQTFLKLVGKKILDQDFMDKLDQMVPSLSGYVIYLGIDEHISELPQTGVNMWVLPNANLELDNIYHAVKDGKFHNIDGYLLYVSPDKRSILAFLVAPFKNKRFWINNKKKLLDALITRIDMDIIPGLQKHIQFKDAATPQTMFRFTLNYKGAAFGWACNPSQLALTDFRKPSFIKGLYLTGHWTTKGFGIPGVMYVGHDTANMILRKWIA